MSLPFDDYNNRVIQNFEIPMPEDIPQKEKAISYIVEVTFSDIYRFELTAENASQAADLALWEARAKRGRGEGGDYEDEVTDVKEVED